MMFYRQRTQSGFPVKFYLSCGALAGTRRGFFTHESA